MVIKKCISAVLGCMLLSSSSYAIMDRFNSLIVAPMLNDTIIVSGPLIIGIVNNTAGAAIKRKGVEVYIDKRKVAIVSTNEYGVWSYMLNASQDLQDGPHLVQAAVRFYYDTLWTQASMFTMKASRERRSIKSGNVSAANSSISFPFNGADINTSTPTITGSLESSTNSAVVGETVQISINSVNIATVTSDSNGVFSYQVSNALSDGNYTVGAYCVQSNVNLTTNSFTIDTTPPAAPVITFPAEYYTDHSSTVIVTGTTEPNATITTFMDGDTFGVVCYADANGNWSNEYDGLANGNHSVTAQATDLAQNTGPVSAATVFTVSV